MYQQRHNKFSSLLICCILLINMILSVTPVYALGEAVVLGDPDESANLLFIAENMYPGDRISKDYILKVNHKENIEICFNAKVQEGYSALAEVLELEVSIVETGEILYEGLMLDTPETVSYTLPAAKQEVTYRLTVSLDEKVGNITEKDPTGKRYQNQNLKADFSWWYLPESTGGDSGGGSGGTGVGGYGGGIGTTKMLRRAYVIGRPGEVFEPEDSITRAETATIFARIFADYDERNLVKTKTKFKDVPETEWFAKYIARCENENIIFGSEGYFRPNDSITRAEFATICVRFFEKRSKSTIEPEAISFTDFDSSHWAYESIKKACANGYVAGYPDGTLKADNIITRAEAVTIVNRMLERVPDKEYIDKNLHKLIDFIDVRDNTYGPYYEIFEAANTHYIRFAGKTAKWVD